MKGEGGGSMVGSYKNSFFADGAMSSFKDDKMFYGKDQIHQTSSGGSMVSHAGPGKVASYRPLDVNRSIDGVGGALGGGSSQSRPISLTQPSHSVTGN